MLLKVLYSIAYYLIVRIGSHAGTADMKKHNGSFTECHWQVLDDCLEKAETLTLSHKN